MPIKSPAALRSFLSLPLFLYPGLPFLSLFPLYPFVSSTIRILFPSYSTLVLFLFLHLVC